MGAGPCFIPGTIIQKQGPVTYLIGMSAAKAWKQHIDQIKSIANKEGKVKQNNTVKKNDIVTSDPEVDFSFTFGVTTLPEKSPNQEIQESTF